MNIYKTITEVTLDEEAGRYFVVVGYRVDLPWQPFIFEKRRYSFDFKQEAIEFKERLTLKVGLKSIS